MKITTIVPVLLAALLVLPGCTKEVGDDVRETGSDMKREVKQAYNDVKDHVEDATENISR